MCNTTAYRKRPAPSNLPPQPHAHRDGENAVDKYDSNTRMVILGLIMEKLMSLQPSLNREKTLILARHLDAKLYQSAPTFSIYADKHTLDERMKNVATRFALAANRRPSLNLFAEERRKLLQRKVGDDMYTEIMNLFEQVAKIRETNDTWTSVIQKQVSTKDSSALCPSVSDSMPSALRGVYFGPRLFEATKQLTAKTSSLQPERVEKPNWEQMLQEARDNIAAFRTFEAEMKASEPEGGDCCTSFGCCFARYSPKRQRV